jgi:uncharacterized protein (TIGR02284 family)
MPPSRELQQAESAMQQVIERLMDSREALQQIGNEIKDESLKHYFLGESLKRAEFCGEIESVLHWEGAHEIKESGTAAGTARRVRADLKSSLGAGDSTLLATAELEEDSVKEAYEKAMDSYLTLPVRQLLTSQAANIQASLHFIQEAREKRAG